ncbi:TIGR03862 family flavoprotein [Labrenzia sp. DG1229]|uniref:TIGR03862 family flavoprotein n=1 Tax=Labrenzia sp. DG1229 TaxID=681847 RepID=UPI00048F4B8C|nr:TIGR03862 family flavoprotein [Labrenzia sp. DG1229]
MIDVLVIGAGPAGLFAADHLSTRGHSVTIIDQMASPARKFLMAGRGGLNLTHSEDLPIFLSRYREAEHFLAPMIKAFPPQALTDWCHDLGQETFVGSSGRVFPKTMKASPLLRALLLRLQANGVQLRVRHRFTGLDDNGSVLIETGNGDSETLSARTVLLALGGASWPKLGATATWSPVLEERGITVTPFQPANCGFLVSWSPFLTERFSGSPLKRIGISVGDRSILGEAILSARGLEGGAIYALSADIREIINREGSASLLLDLRPAMSASDLAAKMSRPRGKQSQSTFLKKTLKLNAVELALLRESGPLPGDTDLLAERIKSIPVTCLSPYPMDRAISSAGGIALEELNPDLMLRKMPGVFAAGEMLDWEAPTGGYLLQACFATGHRAAEGIVRYLDNMTKGEAG